jgi:aspartate aminotransferase-like enzyme
VALGLPPLADDRWAAPGVTAARSRPGVDSAEIVRAVERTHWIRIAGGPPGALAGSVFRVGHLAPGTSDADVDDVLDALAAVVAAGADRGSSGTVAHAVEAR